MKHFYLFLAWNGLGFIIAAELTINRKVIKQDLIDSLTVHRRITLTGDLT